MFRLCLLENHVKPKNHFARWRGVLVWELRRQWADSGQNIL